MITQRIKKYKITIGNHPSQFKKEDKLSNYDAVVDVSDCPTYGLDKKIKNYHWLPITEWDKWGYAPFYFAVKILDHYIKKKSKIYVHCYAGKHRSPMMVYTYLQSLGLSEDEAFKLFKTEWDIKLSNVKTKKKEWLKRFFEKDIQRGRIPKDVIQFMREVRANPDMSILHILDKMNGRTDDISDKDFHIEMSKK
jgi:hypothetical protein